MGNLKKGWYVCESNFIQWRKNYRIWMIAGNRNNIDFSISSWII